MESRNVTLTLDKAKEFYNSGNDALKEVALQAFTKEELTNPEYTNIKTFEGACRALGIVYRTDCDLNYLSRVEGNLGKHLKAIYKLDIIRKALNKGWEPKMMEDSIYYPLVRLYPAGNRAKEVARNNSWAVKETFKANGKKYSMVGGDYRRCDYGLSRFGFGYGDIYTSIGLLGCKSREIAEHMSRYFAKEIFEATYAQHIGAYEWIDKV